MFFKAWQKRQTDKWHQWREEHPRAFGLMRALALIIGVKLLLFTFGLVALLMGGARRTPGEIWPYVVASWTRWDALHYLNIAQFWYTGAGDTNLIAFLPLFPILVRAAAMFAGHYTATAFVMAQVFAVAGLLMFYGLAVQEQGRERALSCLIALLIFPTAYFWNAPYSEGLFLFLAATAFLLARRGRWWLGSFAGGLAAMTRLTGMALLPALLVELLLQRREGKAKWQKVFSLISIPAGFGLYLLANIELTGRPLAFLAVQREHWHRAFAWPWTGLVMAWQRTGSFPWSDYGLMSGLAEAAGGTLLIILLVWALFKLRLSYAVYIAGVTVMAISTAFMMSTPRLVLSAFPVFLLFGNLHKSRVAGTLWILFSVFWLAVFTVRYVRGLWAF